ncbi:MAG TPA: hypothetical protein VFD70_04795 [Anaerolineae bacterium]|nr:hypothetical protein [Anaerolineae bacterium]
MTRRKSLDAPQQASFLEAMLLGIEPEPTGAELPIAPPKNDTAPVAPESAASEQAVSDLFGFILAVSEPNAAKDFWVQSPPIEDHVERTAAVLMAADTLQPSVPASAVVRGFAGENDKISNMVESDALLSSAAQTFLPIAPPWLLEHYPELVARIADVWNVLHEREGLPLVSADAVRQYVAALLVRSIGGARSLEYVENELNIYLQDITRLEQRLYGTAPKENAETVQTLVDRLMKYALHERTETVEWVRGVLEAGVRKMLSGGDRRIYSAIVISALQRLFRLAVRELLEANQFPLSAHVLSHARQNGYRNMMREDLKSLARAGLTMQSASTGWLKALTKEQEQQELLWKARCGERAAIMIQGRTVLNERVMEHPESVLIVTFKCGRAENYYPIQSDDLERAKCLLGAKGFRAEGEEGYPIPENVARLWDDYFSYREYGWWYGDEAGRVIVVIRYNAARKIRNYDRLRRAAAKMQTWGYRLRYTDDALYFLPADVDLPPKVETDDLESDAENDHRETRPEKENVVANEES